MHHSIAAFFLESQGDRLVAANALAFTCTWGGDVAAKYCRVHYRRLSREPGVFPNVTLSYALNAALETVAPDGAKFKDRAIHRIEDVEGQSGYKRMLNNVVASPECVFGTTCLFSPGEMQALVKILEERPHATLAEVLRAYEIAEQQAPAGYEYVHGLSYWLAIQDHFYQIQHVSLQSGAMEKHLIWLLRKAGIIVGNQKVVLQSEFDQTLLGDDDLKFIQVGGLVPETMRAPDNSVESVAPVLTGEIQKRQKVGDKTFGFAAARGILDQLFGPMRTLEMLDRVPPEAALEVSVNIGFRATKRKLSTAFMKDLAVGLRNLPDGEVTVIGKHGRATGADARLYYDIPINRVSEKSGLLVLEHAKEQMQEVHRRLLQDGKIQP